MLRVSTNKGLSPARLATEHTEFRVTQVSDKKCRLVMGGRSIRLLPHDESRA
jgi:hypothetical protein